MKRVITLGNTWATPYEVVFQKHVCVSAANITLDGFTLAEGS